MMNTTPQADENGNLRVPPALLPHAEPLAIYQLQAQKEQIIITKTTPETSEKKPFWQTASPQQRVQALRKWIKEAGTPAGFSEWAVSRDSIYD